MAHRRRRGRRLPGERQVHRLLVALDTDDERPIGFVSGVETTHPDKGNRRCFSWLSVLCREPEPCGVGHALVEALADLAPSRGCYPACGSAPSLTTPPRSPRHLAAGARPPEPFSSLTWTFA